MRVLLNKLLAFCTKENDAYRIPTKPKIEAPSVWRFRIHNDIVPAGLFCAADPSKYFGLSVRLLSAASA